MRFMVICAVVVVASQVQAIELCEKFRCSAFPEIVSVRSAGLFSYGYGATPQKATMQALKRCRSLNVFGESCRVSTCAPYHGPVIPLFPCVDQWQNSAKH